jgi:polar amino acid transport system substrate-binding protein
MKTYPRTRPSFLRFAAAGMLTAAGLFAAPVHALDLVTEDNAPFNYADGPHVGGFSTEILQEMGKRANVPMKFQVLPWARAYQSALSLPDTCVYSTVKLPEREALFKWVGPLTVNKWALFARSDFNRQLKSIEDAKRYRIGGVTMDAKAMYLKSLGFTSIDLVGDDNLNLAKLIAGRIDLWISGLYKGKESAAQVGSKTVKPVMIVREVDYYLACNPKTADGTIASLTHALGALQKEGFVKSVADRYADRTQ